jgi:hypothetical protein
MTAFEAKDAAHVEGTKKNVASGWPWRPDVRMPPVPLDEDTIRGGPSIPVQNIPCYTCNIVL